MRRPGLAGREVAHRRRTTGVVRGHGRIRDALTVTHSPGPPGQLGTISTVSQQLTLRVLGEAQQPDGLPMVREMQLGALPPGGLDELGQDARWHRPPTERRPVSAAHRDHRVQLDVLGLRLARPGQPHGGQQQPIGNGRDQPDHGLAARYQRGQPEIEQRSTAGDMHRAAIRITKPQHPLRVGVQLNGLAARLEAEPPRLAVVHRRRADRGRHHLLHQAQRHAFRCLIPLTITRRGRTTVASHRCAPSLARAIARFLNPARCSRPAWRPSHVPGWPPPDRACSAS
jgi:hypothetical protein